MLKLILVLLSHLYQFEDNNIRSRSYICNTATDIGFFVPHNVKHREQGRESVHFALCDAKNVMLDTKFCDRIFFIKIP